mmetsp:Transcript_51153/g.136593  ORF Transcript_51153/g.136593 Transcript_51153/m.136593 type:complete len:223 (-) Transcript_51153:2303-2971(-)
MLHVVLPLLLVCIYSDPGQVVSHSGVQAIKERSHGMLSLQMLGLDVSRQLSQVFLHLAIKIVADSLKMVVASLLFRISVPRDTGDLIPQPRVQLIACGLQPHAMLPVFHVPVSLQPDELVLHSRLQILQRPLHGLVALLLPCLRIPQLAEEVLPKHHLNFVHKRLCLQRVFLVLRVAFHLQAQQLLPQNGAHALHLSVQRLGVPVVPPVHVLEDPVQFFSHP